MVVAVIDLRESEIRPEMGRVKEDEGLETKLKEAGNMLLNQPPSSLDDLLLLLNHVERCLSRVDQAPRESMHSALYPPMKALISKELLRHSNAVVKVAVASCISEVTRITAPDAPYNDELMKEIFQMIIASFENLFDISNASFLKRVLILETMAKVKSCVMLLDLECDDLILLMFHHFLEAIRESHPQNVFSSMVAIMTIVLEESDEIPAALLSCLFTTVKKENNDVLPIARRLGEKVISNCAVKLKPYLMNDAISFGIDLNDYSCVISLNCQEKAVDVEVYGNLKSVATGHGKLGNAVDKSQFPVSDNGVMVDDSSGHPGSPNKKPEHSCHGSLSKLAVARGKSEPEHPDSSKMVKTAPKLIHGMKKRRAIKPLFGQVTETDCCQMSGAKNKVLKRKKDSDEITSYLSSGIPLVIDLDSSSIGQKANLNSSSVSKNKTVSSPSPSHSQCLPQASLPRRDCRGWDKGSENTGGGLASEAKMILSCNQIGEGASQSKRKKDNEGNSESETKVLRSTAKKVYREKLNDDNPILPTVDVKTENEHEVATSVEEKSHKNVNAGSGVVESTVNLEGGETKQIGKIPVIQKCVTEESNEKDSRKIWHAGDLGEDIVGRRVKVWWPRDKTFYAGVVHSFFPSRGKHKIVYDDGDTEILTLKNQRWAFITDKSVQNEAQGTECKSSNFFKMQEQKKVIALDSTKQAKLQEPLKIGDYAVNESTGLVTQSTREFCCDSAKADRKSKDLKTRSDCLSKDFVAKSTRSNAISSDGKDKSQKARLKDKTSGAALISRDSSSIISKKSKAGNPKISDPFNGNTWKSGRISNANGKSSSFKIETEDTTEGKLGLVGSLECGANNQKK